MNAGVNLAVLDAYNARTTPIVMVPHAKPVDDLAEPGHRYLVAREGVYAQFRRAWCTGQAMVAPAASLLPFGSLGMGSQTASIKFLCGRVPSSLIEEFLAVAQERAPIEVAAWITWREPQESSGGSPWQLRWVDALDQSASHVRFNRPVLDAGEHLVVDIHSHGRHGAFFSETDNTDDADASTVKVAVVLGRVETQLQTVMRLCAGGTFHEIGSLHGILDANR